MPSAIYFRFFGVVSLLALQTVPLAACASTTDRGTPVIVALKSIPVEFTRPEWDKKAHPFTGAAVIDVDGNGKYEVFVGGTQNQLDVLLSYHDGRLINRESGTGLSIAGATTYGVTAIDMDGDGKTDLVVARDDGVYIYLNKGNRHFDSQKIPLNLPPNTVPFQVAVADIDHDGHPDLYVSNFVAFSAFRTATFNDPTHAKFNILLHNNGNKNGGKDGSISFTDITASSSTAGVQNTFSSAFVDLDNDGYQDLVVANNTGEVEIFRNKHDLTFEKVAHVSRLGFWMGIGIGDIDKDGRQDLFFPNVGGSIPDFLTNGDLQPGQIKTHDWLLLHNEGNFHFTDVTKKYGLDDEGFAWGGVFEDLTASGDMQLFVAQNYIKWPVHSYFKLAGRAFVASHNGSEVEYKNRSALGLENKAYGQSSIIVDLDGDGRQDFMWINMEGSSKAFLNRATGNYITVKVPTNARYLGARIRVDTAAGHSYTREVTSSQGFMTSQTPEYTFGIGLATAVQQVLITMPDGSIQSIKDPAINQKIILK
jgi:hypothetical protein